MRQRLIGSQWWYWAVVPILAIVAYLPVLGVGFLSDDYGFLFRAEIRDLRGYLGWRIFLPSDGGSVAFYRPFGMLTTWQLNWQIWGLNPFPYHLLGLLLHAITALILGLWVADVVGKRNTGILAGALFAVLPIHTEAVGWLSAQWDVWATLFAIASLWLFSRWWQVAGVTATSEKWGGVEGNSSTASLYSSMVSVYLAKRARLPGLSCLVLRHSF